MIKGIVESGWLLFLVALLALEVATMEIYIATYTKRRDEDMERLSPPPETYVIPKSYFAFTGLDISEVVESCLELGDDYCTSVQETPDGMQLVLTAEQLDNQIQHNDDFVDGLAKVFESSNSQYQCIGDEYYQTLTLYFDENLSSVTQDETILGIVSSYGMNYMLQNKTTDWNVKVEIFNCHTGKLVASANMPDEEITYGAKEWQKSYWNQRRKRTSME